MTKLVEWRNFAQSNTTELQFVTKLGLFPLLLLNWANIMAIPRMGLVEEFVNIADIDDKTTITACVRG